MIEDLQALAKLAVLAVLLSVGVLYAAIVLGIAVRLFLGAAGMVS